eukprot:755681-Hanusia_phi.AAC.1
MIQKQERFVLESSKPQSKREQQAGSSFRINIDDEESVDDSSGDEDSFNDQIPVAMPPVLANENEEEIEPEEVLSNQQKVIHPDATPQQDSAPLTTDKKVDRKKLGDQIKIEASVEKEVSHPASSTDRSDLVSKQDPNNMQVLGLSYVDQNVLEHRFFDQAAEEHRKLAAATLRKLRDEGVLGAATAELGIYTAPKTLEASDAARKVNENKKRQVKFQTIKKRFQTHGQP